MDSTNDNTKYKSKLWKQGNSFCIRVPMYLINAGLIDPTKEYDVDLKESGVEA